MAVEHPVSLRFLLIVLAAATLGAVGASAQTERNAASGSSVVPIRPALTGLFDVPPLTTGTGRSRRVEGSTQEWWVAEGRSCDGCAWRRPGHAFIQTTLVNVAYGLANLARGQVTARITPATWWGNMKHGWVWDLDSILTQNVTAGSPSKCSR